MSRAESPRVLWDLPAFSWQSSGPPSPGTLRPGFSAPSKPEPKGLLANKQSADPWEPTHPLGHCLGLQVLWLPSPRSTILPRGAPGPGRQFQGIPGQGSGEFHSKKGGKGPPSPAGARLPCSGARQGLSGLFDVGISSLPDVSLIRSESRSGLTTGPQASSPLLRLVQPWAGILPGLLPNGRSPASG